jgi:hypothetical protein
VGGSSMVNNTSGESNCALGVNAMSHNTTGGSNCAFGTNALYSNQANFYNSAFGAYALQSNNTYGNSAFGAYALNLNVSGTDNSAFGTNALRYTVQSANSAFGSYAMFNNKTGGENSAFGASALYWNDSGFYNNCVGNYALYFNKSGSRNCAIGNFALYSNRTASNNSAVGYQALYANTTGFSNAAFGENALKTNVTGSNNAAFGTLAGSLKNQYNKCTFIGVSSDASATGFTNSTAIGYNAIVDASNKVRVGNSNVTSIGGKVGWTTISDIRLKTNIQRSKLGLHFILQLRPVNFNYKDEEQKILYTGLIAQELDAAARKEGVEFSAIDKSGEHWGIRYGELTMPLINAVQELNETQNSKFKSQDEEIAKLKKEIAELKALLVSQNKENVTDKNQTASRE